MMKKGVFLTSNYVFQRVQYAPVQTAVPTTVIKQEASVPSTSARKEVTTIVPATQTATPTSSTMSPMHIEIKKEAIPDELISPQPKTADVPDTPNSISGDSSTGSVLDAQGNYGKFHVIGIPLVHHSNLLISLFALFQT